MARGRLGMSFPFRRAGETVPGLPTGRGPLGLGYFFVMFHMAGTDGTGITPLILSSR